MEIKTKEIKLRNPHEVDIVNDSDNHQDKEKNNARLWSSEDATAYKEKCGRKR